MTSKCILIVEDNPTNMKLAKDVLSFQGFEILCATTGQDAIDSVKENKSKIDLILLDIQLPDISGFEVLKLLKSNKNTEKLPVFILSAYAMEADIDKAMAAGCLEYITKPLNIQSFITKIKNFFEE